MTDAARFWDRIAERYARAPVRAPEDYEATLARVRAYLAPGDRVLELGCGTGTTAVRLADAVAEIVATDVAEGMLAIARQRAGQAGAGNLRFERRGVTEADRGGPFDVVMAFNLLHLLDDLDGALSAMAAALTPGGHLIVKAVCLGEPGLALKYRAFLLLVPLMQRIGKAPWLRYLSVADLEGAVTRAGLEIVETGNYPAMPVSRFVVARKPRA